MKVRLDETLVSRNFFDNIHDAQAAIMAGEIIVNEHRAQSAGQQIDKEAQIRLKSSKLAKKYVSRGGHKLQKALNEFGMSVKGKNCADLGCSTGGFSDCLLKNGAKNVSSIDVGRADFAWELRQDPRISLYENTNVRGLCATDVQGPFDLVVADLSFISIKTVLPDVKNLLLPDNAGDEAELGATSSEIDSPTNVLSAPSTSANKDFITLIKPQFELEKDDVPKGGIVKEATLHKKAISSVINAGFELGFYPKALTYSPITGRKGNIEFLLLLKLARANEKAFASINDSVNEDLVRDMVSSVVSLAHKDLA